MAADIIAFDQRYHAHSAEKRGDGLYGGLVVHRPANTSEKSDLDLYGYRDEILLLIGDWYHQPAKDILAWFMDPLFHGAEVSLLLELPIKWQACCVRHTESLIFGSSSLVLTRC